MNTRHASRWFWPAFAAVCLTVLICAGNAPTQAQVAAQKPDVKTANGLTVVTFIVDPGKITVNLPADVRAGDTISGTVVTEAKGSTPDEKASNKKGLDGYVLDVGGTRVQADRPRFLWTPTLPQPPLPVRYVIKIVEVLGRPIPTTESGAIITPDPKITPPTHPTGAVITPDPKITPPFVIPQLGQTGRQIVITGPFDGDSSNTTIDWTPAVREYLNVRTGVPQATLAETISFNGPELIAESPREAVFGTPSNVTGPIDVKLKEGNVETKGTFRNVGVNLTAPKTSLMKGESTTLTVEVNGLQGIKAPVPLTLTSRGVITMVGGNYQPLAIQPSQVGVDGRYTTTRGITGVQTGGWEATATVVTHKFDVCLQDDTAPARRILWNTFNGDYIFVCPTCWPPKGQAGGSGGTTGEGGGTKTGGAKTGGTTETGGTIPPADPNLPPTDPPGGLTGKGKLIMKGCIITLQHNAPDRRVFATLDSCTTSGSSTAEDPKTKVKFTITDRNIADNTCACGPGCN